MDANGQKVKIKRDLGLRLTDLHGQSILGQYATDYYCITKSPIKGSLSERASSVKNKRLEHTDSNTSNDDYLFQECTRIGASNKNMSVLKIVTCTAHAMNRYTVYL